MAKKTDKVLMTKGNAKATPTSDQVPLWEKQGWVVSQPETASDDAKTDNPEGD